MSTTSSARSSDQPSAASWTRNILGPLILLVVLIGIACFPLYGVLFPPSADLSLHILISKLLWEKLAGVSHLDIEISWYLGYRLWAYLIVAVISFCKLFGMSLVYVPTLVAVAVVSIHAAVIAAIFGPDLSTKPWRSWLPALCFVIPAVICVYSSSWFIGFAGFTLAVSFVVAAVVCSERFLTDGRRMDAILVFIALVLAFGCHPFAIAFWLVWCGSRALVSLSLLTIKVEWKRLLILGVITLPILIYHFLATANTEVLTPDGSGTSSPFVAPGDWYQGRFLNLLGGYYVSADSLARPRPFALLAIALVIIATVVVFFRSNARDLRPAVVASVVFLVIGSWINEDFIPVPKGHWLAYDLRFASAAYAICLTIAGIALIRSLPVTVRRGYRLFINSIALVAAAISAYQLYEIRDAYTRFDKPARAYVDKLFRHERPLRIVSPKSTWYGDAQLFLRRYRCLHEADCNPAGTLFQTVGGDVYPIRVKSPRRTLPADADLTALYGPPGNALAGGAGYAGGEFARPRGLAVDSMGNIYVADTGNGRVQKFDPDGKFLMTFGTYGTGPGEFTEPTGIAVDDMGNIFVTDPPGQKLMRFRADGAFDKEWKGKSSGFVRPMDIEIGPNKMLYVTDLDQHAIVRFEADSGAFLLFGTIGKGNGGFDTLAGIGIGNGLIFVADVGNDLVQVFDLNGQFVRQWEVKAWNKWHFHYPDIAFDASADAAYVSNGGFASEVVMFKSDGQYLTVFRTDDDTELINPSSMVLSLASGRKVLYILNTGSEVKDLGDPRVSMMLMGPN